MPIPLIKNLETVNPDLSRDVMRKIDDIIDRYEHKMGGLIPVLTECQNIIGYLPVEMHDYIGKRLKIPSSDIYGVVTFYSFFTMVPRGKHIIKVCMGTACYVRGIGEILNRIQTGFKLKVGDTTEDRRFSLEAVRCLGACGLAPVVVVDDDTHGGVTTDSILGILEKYQ